MDADNDRLIDIDSLEKLNNIRYSLDGTSYKTSSDDTGVTAGCPKNVCKGYELMANLDFDTDGSGSIDEGDDYWNGGEGWEPIGNRDSPFDAIFEGNGRTIANLLISREATQTEQVGLFGTLDAEKTIRNLGLVNVAITHKDTAGNASRHSSAGALAGALNTDSSVTAVYMTGTVVSLVDIKQTDSGFADGAIGGLVGFSQGNITASYAVTIVSGNRNTGGLVGQSFSGGIITTSYAIATVSGNLDVGGLAGQTWGRIATSYASATVLGNTNVGGLVGHRVLQNIISSYAIAIVSGSDKVGGLIGNASPIAGGESAIIRANYAIAEVSGNTNVGGLAGGFDSRTIITDSYFDATVSGLTDPQAQSTSTEALQMPTEAQGYTGIYQNWNVDIDDDSTAGDPWHFGSNTQYPGLSLPQFVSGNCPTTSGNIVIEPAEDRCIHRPSSIFVLRFGLVTDDDTGVSNTDRITDKRQVRLTGRVFPPQSNVRIFSLPDNTEVATVTADSGGVFTTATIALDKRFNRFRIFVQQSGTTGYIGPLDELVITRDPFDLRLKLRVFLESALP